MNNLQNGFVPVIHNIRGLLYGRKIIISEHAPRAFTKWLESSGAKLLIYRALTEISDIGDHPDTGILHLIDRSYENHYFAAPGILDAADWFNSEKNFQYGDMNPASPYPKDTLYNMIQVRNKDKWYLIAGKQTYIMSCISEFCRKNDINIVKVNQGYVRCNALVTDFSSRVSNVVTSDPSLKKRLHELGINVLVPPDVTVALRGYSSGFFPGACGICEKGIILCGAADTLGETQLHQIRKISEISGLAFYMPHKISLKVTDVGSLFIL